MTSAPSPLAGSDRIGWPIWRLAGVIVFGAFTSGLDASLVNIGLDVIGTDLGADLARVQWVASGYLLALAVSLPLAGWLGRRVGVGRLWLAALAAFTVTSGLCALAPDAGSLIALRVLQGLAGGLLIPAGQTVLGQAVGSARLGRVMATLGIAVTVAPALGPVLGGLLLESTSWRWLFAINVPIGVLGLALGLRYVPRGESGRAPRLDRVGLLLVSAGLPLLVYGLTAWGEQRSPQPGALIPLGFGVAALAGFVGHARGRRSAGLDSLLDLGLYRNRVFAAASAASGCTGMLMFGSGLLFPLYFQLGQGEGLVDTGLRLLGVALPTALALPFVGWLVDRHGGGLVATIGTALLVAGTVPFAVLPLTADPVLVQALLALIGVAIALAAVPPGIAAYQSVRPEQLADATTAVNIVQRVGGAIGSALFAVVLAGGLAGDVESAFHAAFAVMAGAGVLALAATLWLTSALRRP